MTRGATARPAGLTGGDAVTRHLFEYAVLRVVPRVERGEAINAGVLLYCRALDFLGARMHLDDDRLRALDAGADAGRDPAARSTPRPTSAPGRGAAGPAGGRTRAGASAG